MIPIEILLNDFLFRLTSLDWLGRLDIALVVFVYFVALIFLQRSRVAYLLRGIVLLGIFLLMIAVFLPLPTFDWIINVLFLVILIATPVIFAPEIRRLLENIGRTVGLSRSVKETTAETVTPELIRVLEHLAPVKTGALIVLEGEQSLDEVIKTGIPVNGRVSSELLQTIFHDKTPLHDGAVIIRGETVVAAGCVLPLTEQKLKGNNRRFGTRHRAAVGISETTDALTLVVSEETGHVSTTHFAHLNSNLDILEVRTALADFYTAQTDDVGGRRRLSLWPAMRQFMSKALQEAKQIGLLRLGVTLLSATILAFITWAYVLSLTNPTEQKTITNIPLVQTEYAPELVLMNTLPRTVTVELKSTAELMPLLDANSVSASLRLDGLDAGRHELPVVLSTTADVMEVINIEPHIVTVELAESVTRTVPITVDMVMQNLSAAYEIVGEPMATPSEVMVSGPKPFVEQVTTVVATLSVDNPTSSIQEIRPLTALDVDEVVVDGVQLSEVNAQIELEIAQREDARDVGVRAITNGAPPEGYWLSGLAVTPSTVTIQGDTAVLNQTGTFIDTLPIDVSQTTGALQIEIPLNIPENLEATDANGQPVRTVLVNVQVSARTSDLAITRTVQIDNLPPNMTVSLAPETIDLLLSGPTPILNDIENNPEMVRVFIDAANFEPDQIYDVAPEIMVSESVTVQLAPTLVSVTTARLEEDLP